MTGSRPDTEAFCQADSVFYDLTAPGPCFTQTALPARPGWTRSEQGLWVVHRPDGRAQVEQGWKVHVSSVPERAQHVIDTVWDYCIARSVPFKFLRGPKDFVTFNAKYAPRASSGKLVTIYPEDTDRLRQVLTELGALLRGEPGPYILTDLRWEDGPLYVRYGAFVTLYCQDDDGEQVLAIRRPDGVLVPDRRRPVFDVPDWVEVPDFLAEAIAARDSAQGPGLPYHVEQALHFSNGGGVYLARDRDGRALVLKEARPYAGLDGRGRDAVARLDHEHAALLRLAGLPGIPALYGRHTVWEHHFLAMERIEGVCLQEWLAREYPLTKADPTPEELRAYAERAIALGDRIAAVLAGVHERGMVFGDLHPGNVIVGDGDEIHLIDFELTQPVEEAARLGLGHPGFTAPGRTGFDIDRYALAALRLWLLFPLNGLFELDPHRAARHADLAEQRFGLPAGALDSIRAELSRVTTRPAFASELGHAPPVPPADDAWAAVRSSLAEAILLSADPRRQDRLFPGDVRQFHTDGVNFAYGAAGVLWALSVTGAGRAPELEEWLIDAAARTPVRPGFMDGAHGVAYALEELGHTDQAIALLDRAADPAGNVSLFRGLAGVALTYLHFAHRTGDDRFDVHALALADALAEAVDTGRTTGLHVPKRGSRAGLLHGWSGPALFFLRLHERTGDPAHLDVAVRALHRDLDLCRVAADGSLQVDGGFRTLPYLEVGSAGIALVAAEVLARRHDSRLEQALPALVKALEPEFVVEPHLFRGRAGFIATLAMLDRPDLEPLLRRHIDRLSWHALGYRGHLAFPGEQLRRLSMDVATGSAGVLLALDRRGRILPFLRPLSSGRSACRILTTV